MRRLCTAAAAVALFPLALDAQNPSPTGNLYGKVTDAEGRAALGAVITLAGPGESRTISPDGTGEFRFLTLAPGTYSLTLQHPGWAAVRRDGIEVAVGRNTEVFVTLPLAVGETVTVTGDLALGDSRETRTGSTFAREELDAIPTGRDPWVILQQVPGVLLDTVNVAGNTSTVQSRFVGRGAHSDQNTYNLDGVEVTVPLLGTTPIYFDFDSLEQIEVATGGSDPALASPGVSLNLVTKRGTDELKGSGRFYYTSRNWQSDNTPEEAGDRGFRTDETRFVRDFGGEAGGPLVRDGLWLWGSGSRVDVDLSRTTRTFPDGTIPHQLIRVEAWNVKANGQIGGSNSITAFYLHSLKATEGAGLGVDRPPETTSKVRGPTAVIKIEDSHVFSGSLFASAYYASVNAPFRASPLGGRDEQVYIDADGVWHNSFVSFEAEARQHQAGLTASHFFQTGRLSHELKFGFGYRHAPIQSASAWPGNRLIGDDLFGIAWLTRDAERSFELRYGNVFLQDTVTSGRWTISAAVRFDDQRGRNLASSVAANPVFPDLLPAVRYPGDADETVSWQVVQPRIATVCALGKSRKTLLKASYSRFANQLRDEIVTANIFPGIAYMYFYWTDQNRNHRVEADEVDTSELLGSSGVDPRDPGRTTSPNRLSPNLRAPTTDEWILAIDRELIPRVAASLVLTYRSLKNLESTSPVGATAADYVHGGNASGTVTASNGFVLRFDEPYFVFARSPPPEGVELQNRPGYRETYQGAEIQVVKRLSQGWMLRGSIGYNDWRKDVSGRAIVNPNNLLGGTNEDGGVVAEPSELRTSVFINSTWQFSVSGLYQLPLGVEARASFFGRQGYVLPYFVRVLTRGTAEPVVPIQIGEVDSRRLPDVYQLDLSLARSFEVGPATVTPSFDVFNVLNRATVLQRDINAGQYDSRRAPGFGANARFNQIREVQGPRILRLGARVSF